MSGGCKSDTFLIYLDELRNDHIHCPLFLHQSLVITGILIEIIIFMLSTPDVLTRNEEKMISYGTFPTKKSSPYPHRKWVANDVLQAVPQK